jgi:hypothetical protein
MGIDKVQPRLLELLTSPKIILAELLAGKDMGTNNIPGRYHTSHGGHGETRGASHMPRASFPL